VLVVIVVSRLTRTFASPRHYAPTSLSMWIKRSIHAFHDNDLFSRSLRELCVLRGEPSISRLAHLWAMHTSSSCDCDSPWTSVSDIATVKVCETMPLPSSISNSRNASWPPVCILPCCAASCLTGRTPWRLAMVEDFEADG
jgi:hypothetical protein